MQQLQGDQMESEMVGELIERKKIGSQLSKRAKSVEPTQVCDSTLNKDKRYLYAEQKLEKVLTVFENTSEPFLLRCLLKREKYYEKNIKDKGRSELCDFEEFVVVLKICRIAR